MASQPAIYLASVCPTTTGLSRMSHPTMLSATAASTLTTSQSQAMSSAYPPGLPSLLIGTTPWTAQIPVTLPTLSMRATTVPLPHTCKPASASLTCGPVILASSSSSSSSFSSSAKVDDATKMDTSGLRWFKIYEDGFDAGDQSWGVDRMIKNKGEVTFKIPACIAPGQYLLRHELIALHAASSYPGAQLYMECAQLEITGGGSTSPPTVSFPGAYKGSDPGIAINIYQNLASYTVPGPPVFTC